VTPRRAEGHLPFFQSPDPIDHETRAASVLARCGKKNHETDKDSSQFSFMAKLSTKLKEEFFAMLPPAIFFFVALHIIALVHALMLKGTGISPVSSMPLAVAALILGKAVLIADMLPMINRFPDKPLIYNVAWKTLVYLLAATLVHYLEHLVDFWRQAGGFVTGSGRVNPKSVRPSSKESNCSLGVCS
jgi:hypothetical protein